jgi:phytoene/squalene synthetase
MSGPTHGGLGLRPTSSAALARAITRRASRQTYYIVRFLVDRGRTDDAFRAYAYFRWVDDVVDAPSHDRTASLQFLSHQRQLLSGLLEGRTPGSLLPQEQMLADLLTGRRDRHPGLQSYVENMMAVMEFDAGRRGRLITQPELDRCTSLLATAVWDCIEYFIGHAHRYPASPAPTQAVTGAHVIHMLRDTHDDVEAGYFNIPRDVLEANRMTPSDVHHPAYRRWVRDRVEQARRCFTEGKAYLRRMGCMRAQVASYLYCARFEVVLRQIELDGYSLRSEYSKLPPMLAWMSRFLHAPRAAMYGPRKTPTGDAS